MIRIIGFLKQTSFLMPSEDTNVGSITFPSKIKATITIAKIIRYLNTCVNMKTAVKKIYYEEII